MSDVITVVEGLDFVVSLAAGHVHPDDLSVARGVAGAARAGAGHLGATMVLALVGGTGSGKSSLLNALAGEAVASTSPVRPHTTDPLAWIPDSAEPALGWLLDRLGVDHRVTQNRFEGLAILDMTDVDSVVGAHRLRVEALLPEVDVVVWVLDPVKYADPLLHRDFIRPLAESSDRLIFVLNQADRLDNAQVDSVRSDLRRLLEVDGVSDPAVFLMAADPPGGEPFGVAPLATYLEAQLDEKRVHVGKIIDDARRAALAVANAAGVSHGASVDFEERWESLRRGILTDFAAGGRASAHEEALRLLEGFIRELSTDTGGEFGVRIRQSFRVERVEEELQGAVNIAAGASDQTAALDAELQERFGAPLRKMLWERASLAAVVAGLAVDAEIVDGILGRAVT